MGRSPRNVLSLVLDVVPHYSTDIAAAWQVVECMKERGLNLHLFVYAYNRTYAAFGLEAPLEGDGMAEGNGEHATETAVCLAALKAVAERAGRGEE